MTDDPATRLSELTDLATPFAVRVVATLRIPDLIASGTCHLDGLATTTGTDPLALGRLLRYLVHRDVFTEPDPDVFAMTEVGRLLCENGPAGRRGRLDLTSLGARMDLAYGGLLHSVRTGEAAYATVHRRVARSYGWHRVAHVVDVGGGNGGLLAELLTAHPHLTGTLVDRPGPTPRTTELLRSSGVAERAEVVAGDFFGELPRGGDVYAVSRVLSDWNDQDATAILRRCREAAGANGRVLIVEVLPREPPLRHLSPFDLRMLVVVGGRERSPAEFEALAGEAGLAVTSVELDEDGLALIECVSRGPARSG